MYEWVKALHLIFMVTWFAGLFYLPRLFVYHAGATDEIGVARFKIMEHKLYYAIMTPGALLTLTFGVWLLVLLGYEWTLSTSWLHAKLCLLVLLIAYHIYLGFLLKVFKDDGNRHSHVFYRWLNELPVLVLVGAVLLAVLKPAL